MFSLKDAGVFVPPNDTESERFTTAILELINDEGTRRMLGYNATRRAKQLTWDKVSVPLIQTYECIRTTTPSG